MKRTRSRSWVFTLNNYTPDDVAELKKVTHRYMCFGLETGDKEHTPHIQGYVQLDNPVSLRGVKKLLGDRFHVDIAKGTPEQNLKYCSKQHLEFESGQALRMGQRTDIADIYHLMKKKRRFTDVCDFIPGAVRYPQAFKMIRAEVDEDDVPYFRKVVVSLYYGDTNTGKTTGAMYHPDVYKLTKKNNLWFCGYRRHQRLVIDDLDGWIPYRQLLTILDGHPLQVEVKGGQVWAFWTEVIITSNLMPDYWYKDEYDISALKRRIHNWVKFPVVHTYE